MDVKCAHLDAAGVEIVRDIVVDLGYVAEDAAVTSTPKISGGKVTGYNLTGVTTSGWTSHLDTSKMMGSCDTAAGEHWAGWGGETPGRWHYTPVAGSGLQVSIGSKTADLPNTPVVVPGV
jgi:hypothetical protein